MSNKIIEIKNLTKEYEDFKLDNISFSLDRGYIMGFIGENGAGKTTTIKLIMNLLKRDEGEIEIFGKDNIDNEREIKERIGFVYDECFYYENLSIKDNEKIISGFYKRWNTKVFENYLRKFNLNKKQKVKELSKGMKMKFAIALALSHNAEFLILDEPASGLDPVMRRDILDVFQEVIQDENVGILISSHIISDLEKISDYITYIQKGKIVFSKATSELMEEYKIIKGDKALLSKLDEKVIYGLRETPYGFEGIIKDKHIEKSIRQKIVSEKPSLEEIMVAMNKGVRK
ncbi:sodium ABC transporter ATP-binding protein [Clostridium sulfidigenes]|uniref:Sodium ABC transporter ATP-binding protein n=1 Tax=Clostridium sulfidigenes TaxID=318464 RepID=A0A084JCL7_9CLOT|nr:ABC transporter ATP-binding protein [Clostridium sulfidigenes]KEZ86701.1 sodium ABC transporter ATP-binding protein [Clostridium sulfidigenes]